jgi:hypothetical protein
MVLFSLCRIVITPYYYQIQVPPVDDFCLSEVAGRKGILPMILSVLPIGVLSRYLVAPDGSEVI